MANWENFQRLRDHIALQPAEQVRMDKLLFINRDKETVAEARRPECGTVGCIAGHGFCLFSEADVILQRKDMKWGLSNVSLAGDMAVKVTAHALDITHEAFEEDEGAHVFFAKWHPAKHWGSGKITKDEVLAYLDKAIAAKDLMVSL